MVDGGLMVWAREMALCCGEGGVGPSKIERGRGREREIEREIERWRDREIERD